MKLLGRYILLGFGLLLMGLGIALITQAKLGTSPISTVPLVASYITPLSFGVFSFVLSLLFMVVQLIILKKLFDLSLIAQMIVGIFFGFFVDLGMYVFSFVHPTSIIVQLIAFIIGCTMLSMGIYLQVIANVVMNAGEAIVKLIAEKYDKDFGTVKIILDWTLVATACLLSFVFLHNIRGIGLGTLVSAFLVGYIIKVMIIMKEMIKRRMVTLREESRLHELRIIEKNKAKIS
ncbi:YczE/YyaS/YitT family protein [Rummeliibacillus sp. JY-2-4R]